MLTASYALLFLSLVACCIAAVASYVAVSAAGRAEGIAGELSGALRRLKAVQDAVAATDARLDKIAGRVYAQSRKAPPAEPEQPETPEQIRARLNGNHPGVRAQLADPATHR